MAVPSGATVAASISENGILGGNSSAYKQPKGVAHITRLRNITVFESHTISETTASQANSSVGAWTADI